MLFFIGLETAMEKNSARQECNSIACLVIVVNSGSLCRISALVSSRFTPTRWWPSSFRSLHRDLRNLATFACRVGVDWSCNRYIVRNRPFVCAHYPITSIKKEQQIENTDNADIAHTIIALTLANTAYYTPLFETGNDRASVGRGSNEDRFCH